MADVRKLLQAERAARTAGGKSSAKRPRQESATSSPVATISQKRRRTSPEEEGIETEESVAGLPEGFFDNPGGSSENIVVDRNQRPPTPPADESVQTEGLPSDFFSKSGGNKAEEPETVDEDEWAAFQAEVVVPTAAMADAVITAAPVLHGQNEEEEQLREELDVEEIDDAKERLLEEFEEMQTLEQRVLKLKNKREELRKAFSGVAPMDTGPTKMEEDEDEDDDDEEDDDDWMRR